MTVKNANRYAETFARWRSPFDRAFWSLYRLKLADRRDAAVMLERRRQIERASCAALVVANVIAFAVAFFRTY